MLRLSRVPSRSNTYTVGPFWRVPAAHADDRALCRVPFKLMLSEGAERAPAITEGGPVSSRRSPQRYAGRPCCAVIPPETTWLWVIKPLPSGTERTQLLWILKILIVPCWAFRYSDYFPRAVALLCELTVGDHNFFISVIPQQLVVFWPFKFVETVFA